MASMDKYVELIKMLEKIFGKGSVSRTIGTRTNVVRFPRGQIVDDLDTTKSEYNIEKAAEKKSMAYGVVKKDIEDRMGDITKMNDSELLNYTANVRRMMNVEFPPPLPEADIVKFGSGQEIKGEGLEKLIQKQGTKFSPTTDIGKLEATGKRLEKLSEDFAKEFDPANNARLEAERQAMIARQYEGKGYAGGVFGPSGMYRAVARNFLLDEAAKGKIKLSPDTIKNLQERNYISGGQPLMYADPIRIMRYHYGDDVFEKIPLDKIPTGAPSEIIEAMSKVEVAPIKTEAPKTPGGYLTPGEYRANIEEMQKIEEAIKRRESRFADMTEEEIQNELAQYGGKRSSFEMGLEYDYPEEYAKYKGPKKPEPEEKADGGIIGRRGMFLGGFLSRLINSNPQIISSLKEQQPTSDLPLTLQERYRKYLSESETPPDTSSPIGGLIGRFLKGSGIAVPQSGSTSTNDFLYNLYKKNLEQKADGGRIGYKGGKRVLTDIDKLIEKLNKKTKGKKSMESVNPKTGEVTLPKKPIRRAEEPTGTTVMDAEPDIVDERSIKKTKSRQLTKEEIEDYSEQLGDTETWLSEGTVEEAEKALKRIKDQEAYYYGQYKMGKLDPAPGEQTENRMKFLQKKLEEAEMTKDRRLITPNEVEELMSLEKTFSQSSEQVLENEMNRVLNQYDKSMFIKDAEGRVDVSNPANAEKMAMLLKRDHPEIYNKIYNLGEDLGQKQVLEDFDITGREPNAKGGIAGLL